MNRTWELGELTTRSGWLSRPFGATKIPIPARVELRGDRLVSQYGPKSRWKEPGPGLLEEFVNLTRGDELNYAAVERYAKRWGTLGICKHGKPYTHLRDGPVLNIHIRGRGDDDSRLLHGCPPLGYAPRKKPVTNPELWEPLVAWESFSRSARAVMNVAAQLHQGDPGNVEDWYMLIGHDSTLERWTEERTRYMAAQEWRGTWRSRISSERWWVSNLVNFWLEDGDVRWQCTWEESDFALTTGVQSLYGAIVIQLALAVGRVEALATCSNCRTAYIPSRKPVEGRRRYCSSCQDAGVPQRDATASLRGRRQAVADRR